MSEVESAGRWVFIRCVRPVSDSTPDAFPAWLQDGRMWANPDRRMEYGPRTFRLAGEALLIPSADDHGPISSDSAACVRRLRQRIDQIACDGEFEAMQQRLTSLLAHFLLRGMAEALWSTPAEAIAALTPALTRELEDQNND